LFVHRSINLSIGEGQFCSILSNFLTWFFWRAIILCRGSAETKWCTIGTIAMFSKHAK
jgi:hypothetical protein